MHRPTRALALAWLLVFGLAPSAAAAGRYKVDPRFGTPRATFTKAQWVVIPTLDVGACALLVAEVALHLGVTCYDLRPRFKTSGGDAPEAPKARDESAWDDLRHANDPTIRGLSELIVYGRMFDPFESLEPREGQMMFKVTPSRIIGGAFGLTITGAF